jgi:hypothetical protein
VYAEVYILPGGWQFLDLFSKNLIFLEKDPPNLREVDWIFWEDATNLLPSTSFPIQGFRMSKYLKKQKKL